MGPFLGNFWCGKYFYDLDQQLKNKKYEQIVKKDEILPQ